MQGYSIFKTQTALCKYPYVMFPENILPGHADEIIGRLAPASWSLND